MEHTAESTFRTRREADAYLAAIRADLDRDAWIDPVAGQVPLARYAWRWLDERPGLRPRTRELYESELRLHILPALGSIEVAKLIPATVRSWHAQLLKAGRPGPTTVAKCYRQEHASTPRRVIRIDGHERPSRTARAIQHRGAFRHMVASPSGGHMSVVWSLIESTSSSRLNLVSALAP